MLGEQVRVQSNPPGYLGTKALNVGQSVCPAGWGQGLPGLHWGCGLWFVSFLPEVLGGCFAELGGEGRVDGGKIVALLLMD